MEQVVTEIATATVDTGKERRTEFFDLIRVKT